MYSDQHPASARFYLENRRYVCGREDDGRRTVRRHGRTLHLQPDSEVQSSDRALKQNSQVKQVDPFSINWFKRLLAERMVTITFRSLCTHLFFKCEILSFSFKKTTGSFVVVQYIVLFGIY